jgi:hypothetical protein
MINLISRKDEKPSQSLLKKRDKDGFIAPIWKLPVSGGTSKMTTKFHILLYFFGLTLISCGDIDKNIEESLNNASNDTQAEMTADIINSKKLFEDTYKNALTGSTDSAAVKKITKLHLTINETSKYIDSLQIEIRKLDNKDVKNSDLIKKIFLIDGIGDIIFNKVKFSYNCAMDIALEDTTKARLKTVQDIYSSETKKQFFDLNSPDGVNMILYGIESELIKDGTKCLVAFKPN